MLDICGAKKDFVMGEPTGKAAPEIGCRAASKSPCFEVLGYAADPVQVDSDLATHRSLVDVPSKLGLLLRPMSPDSQAVESWRRNWLWSGISDSHAQTSTT
jgi:hypothetical protein